MNDEDQKTALLFVFLQKYLYICKLEKLKNMNLINN